MTLLTLSTAWRRARAPKMVLVSSTGQKLTLPLGPTGFDLGGMASVWTEQARPGLKPLHLRTGGALRSCSWTFPLGDTSAQISVEPTIAALRRMSEAGGRVRVSGASSLEAGPWRITDATVAVTARTTANQASRASVTLQLVEANDVTVTVAKLPAPLPRQYKVKKGDTLRKLAARFYGDPKLWTLIGRKNGIKKGTAALKVGRKLTIPKKSTSKKRK